MSFLIVLGNFLFVLCAGIIFVKEYLSDFQKRKRARRSTIKASEMAKEHLQIIRRFGGIHAKDSIEPVNTEGLVSEASECQELFMNVEPSSSGSNLGRKNTTKVAPSAQR